MKPLLLLVALLALSGCDESARPKSLMETRLPDNETVMIVTDEAGQRYTVKRYNGNWYLFDVTPYNPPKPPAPTP